MEFGFLTQGYLPKAEQDADPNAEHNVLMDDFELCLAAEAAGFKYVWISEHHFLDEYSHLSASDVYLGALAHATSTSHIGSGIFNPLPKVHHPAAVAEKVAMLDHLSEGRFEFGTGRGAGSHEVTGFHTELPDVSNTRAIWEETIGEFAKMWLSDEYPGFDGQYWSMPPRKILPKPYGAMHPAMWYAAGNPLSFEMAGQKGLGAIGFSLDELAKTEKAIHAYKAAIVERRAGRRLRQRQPDRRQRRDVPVRGPRRGTPDVHRGHDELLPQPVYRYHDTFPRPAGIPAWPEVMPPLDETALDGMIALGSAIVGDPDDAIAQFKRWEATGADQFLLVCAQKTKEETLQMIRLMGEHIIPKFDTDPVHRTTRLREAASAAIAA